MFPLGPDELRTGRQLWSSETYPREIPVDHTLVVHIDQPPSDIFELW